MPIIQRDQALDVICNLLTIRYRISEMQRINVEIQMSPAFPGLPLQVIFFHLSDIDFSISQVNFMLLTSNTWRRIQIQKQFGLKPQFNLSLSCQIKSILWPEIVQWRVTGLLGPLSVCFWQPNTLLKFVQPYLLLWIRLSRETDSYLTNSDNWMWN